MSEVELQRREQDLEAQSKSLKIFKERLLKETQGNEKKQRWIIWLSGMFGIVFVSNV